MEALLLDAEEEAKEETEEEDTANECLLRLISRAFSRAPATFEVAEAEDADEGEVDDGCNDAEGEDVA